MIANGSISLKVKRLYASIKCVLTKHCLVNVQTLKFKANGISCKIALTKKLCFR